MDKVGKLLFRKWQKEQQFVRFPGLAFSSL